MSVIVKAPVGGDFKPAPAGRHQGVCVDVVDLGEVETPWGNKRMVQLRWEVEEEGERYLVLSRYAASLHPKAKLREVLETWRSRAFTDKELEGFDLEKLIGINCELVIVHKPREQGGVWANVQAVLPPPKGMGTLKPGPDYVRVQDRDDYHEPATSGDGAAASEFVAHDDDIPF